MSCHQGHVEVARLLIENGADINKADDDGDTPLYASCQNGHLQTTRLLLLHGAEGDRQWLASWAREEGHLQLAGWLEQCVGWTVWQHVCESRREDLLLKMLLDEDLVGSCPDRVELLGGRVGEMGWSCLELAKADGSSRLGGCALPVSVSFVRLVERAMEPWSQETHGQLWPLSFRAGVREVLLVGRRICLPIELLLHMLSFCGCDWFQASAADGEEEDEDEFEERAGKRRKT